MKIGEFAKKHHVPNSTVRFYIELGLLIPQKNGAQFIFGETDDFEMRTLKDLKDLGYTLKESQKYISMMRLYRKNDTSVNEKLLELLEEKQQSLLQERKQINRNLKAVRNKIADFRCAEKPPAESRSITDQHGDVVVPLEFVAMLECPKCGSKLKLDQACIINSGVADALLSCSCGYQAKIENGMLYAGKLYDHEQDPDFRRCFYGEYSSTCIYDDIFFESSSFNSPESMIANHKGTLRIRDQVLQLGNGRHIIVMPDISCHLLYKIFEIPLLENSLIIVPTITPATINPIVPHINDLPLKVLYVINQDGELPFSRGIVDTIIDYGGMGNFSFFSKTHFLDLIKPYLKSSAELYSCTECYESNAKSLSNINASYKFSIPSNMSWDTLKKSLSNCCFEIIEREVLGEYKNPGNFWEYHQAGDVRSTIYYHAKRK